MIIPEYIIRVTYRESKAIITRAEYEVRDGLFLSYFTLCDILHYMKKGVLIKVELMKTNKEVVTQLYPKADENESHESK